MSGNIDKYESDQFVLVGRLNALDEHAEGFSQFFFGYPFSKVLFHTIIEPKRSDSKEIRKATQYLTLPTVTAIEFAHMVLSNAKNHEEQILRELNSEAKSRIASMLADIDIKSNPKPVQKPSADVKKTGLPKRKD